MVSRTKSVVLRRTSVDHGATESVLARHLLPPPRQPLLRKVISKQASMIDAPGAEDEENPQDMMRGATPLFMKALSSINFQVDDRSEGNEYSQEARGYQPVRNSRLSPGDTDALSAVSLDRLVYDSVNANTTWLTAITSG